MGTAEAKSECAERWFQAGDLDGFFGLFIDNLIQLLLIIGLCSGVLGFPQDLIFGRILPGAAISLVVGNVYYAWQARRIARATGKADITALPYGINTVSLFAYIFFVMLPVKLAVSASSDPVVAASAPLVAWQVGLAACVGSGLIELFGAFVAAPIKRLAPRAALLSALAGIAVTFISMDFVFQTFQHPLVALVPLFILLSNYLAGAKLAGPVPGGMLAVIAGTALAWLTRLAGPELSPADPSLLAAATGQIGLHLPVSCLPDLLAGFANEHFWAYFSIVFPMGLFNLIGSLQNIESAEAAGDSFPVKESLAVNGVGTLAAAVMGSCFPTTIYIGHPGWKAMGARYGYSILNAVAITILILCGLVSLVNALVPIAAGMAILLWIGIIMTAQATQAVPRSHAPAVAVGLLPCLAAWGWLLLSSGVRSQTGGLLPVDMLASPASFPGIAVSGMISLERGFLLTSMVLAAITVEIIERRFRRACGWALAGAALSLVGIIHTFALEPAGVRHVFSPAAGWPYAAAYGLVALLMLRAGSAPRGELHLTSATES